MSITYRNVKGKTVICKDGVYMSFTRDELKELKLVLADINNGDKRYYKEDARN